MHESSIMVDFGSVNFNNVMDQKESRLKDLIRQSYVENLEWKKYIPFVNSLSYAGTPSSRWKNVDMHCSYPSNFFGVKHFPCEGIDIKIFDYAFDGELLKNESDFKHSLYNFHGYNAKMMLDNAKNEDHYDYISEKSFDRVLSAIRGTSSMQCDDFDYLLESHRLFLYAISALGTTNTSLYSNHLEKRRNQIEEYIFTNPYQEDLIVYNRLFDMGLARNGIKTQDKDLFKHILREENKPKDAEPIYKIC